MRVTVIAPRGSWSRQDIFEMIEFRWVLFMLIVRDIKLRYKQTFLGVVWVVLQPLMTAALFTVIFGRWLHVETGEVPYMLFAFCGLIPWLVFSQSVQRAAISLVNEAPLVQKVYFPRLFLPLAGTLGTVLDFVCALATLAVLMGVYHYPLSWQCLLFPVGALLIFIFSTAFNTLFAALSAHYRDFKHIVPFFLQFWMYASPLAYSIASMPPKWQLILSLNPLTGIIEFFRWSLLHQIPFPYQSFSIACTMSLALLWISLVVFRRLEWTLTDVI